ncbi:MAG TPA: hypothetical protein VJL61_03135 [Rhodanobacteraceae bacterium]|nr:hypothetical protein [Rhodanobacteraceae bacterium]
MPLPRAPASTFPIRLPAGRMLAAAIPATIITTITTTGNGWAFVRE